jgi:hypothetical protein
MDARQNPVVSRMYELLSVANEREGGVQIPYAMCSELVPNQRYEWRFFKSPKDDWNNYVGQPLVLEVTAARNREITSQIPMELRRTRVI